MVFRNPLRGEPFPLPVAEEYRRLTSSLRMVAPSAKSIMVVSCAEGEGTTTVAMRLARSFTENPRCRVLLVDANVLKPSLHRWFDLDLAPGLLECDGVRAPVYHETATVPNLWVLTAGLRDEHSLTSVQVSEALEIVAKRIREDFDVTIWDSAPISQYPDGLLLARLVDGVLVVVQPDRTRVDALTFLRDEFAQSGANVLGAVLNRNGRFYPRTLRTGPGR
jgi:succinoglycan biosynthesis transport protein ExoP